jgi:hypothetical protein
MAATSPSRRRNCSLAFFPRLNGAAFNSHGDVDMLPWMTLSGGVRLGTIVHPEPERFAFHEVEKLPRRDASIADVRLWPQVEN